MVDQVPSLPWQCSVCSEEVDGGFAVCWNCGTAFDGTVDPAFERGNLGGSAQSSIVRSGAPFALITLILLALLTIVARDDTRPPLIDLLLIVLVAGMAGNIQELLDELAPLQDPHRADTAIFYSISNAQKGLAGISFGGFLIKRVVDQLASEFGRLKNFATLSPIPGFSRWLRGALSGDGTPGALGLDAAARTALQGSDWHRDTAAAAALQEPLMRLCAHYLVTEKWPDGRALDRVAQFHLSNGAQVERLNWLADQAPNGMAQSAGMMINYQYRLDRIESNHEAYTGRGDVAASSAIRALLKG